MPSLCRVAEFAEILEKHQSHEMKLVERDVKMDVDMLAQVWTPRSATVYGCSAASETLHSTVFSFQLLQLRSSNEDKCNATRRPRYSLRSPSRGCWVRWQSSSDKVMTANKELHWNTIGRSFRWNLSRNFIQCSCKARTIVRADWKQSRTWWLQLVKIHFNEILSSLILNWFFLFIVKIIKIFYSITNYFMPSARLIVASRLHINLYAQISANICRYL